MTDYPPIDESDIKQVVARARWIIEQTEARDAARAERLAALNLMEPEQRSAEIAKERGLLFER